MNTLTINNLSLKYKNGTVALDNVSLNIRNGMFGLLGPNGAGKSSLMKTIVGLQKPTNGQVFFNDINVVESPLYIKKQLGFLPQDFGVYPRVSAYDLLQHLAVLKGLQNATERKAQILHLLERVNLIHARNKDVHSFSGGMKQRFGVAQALLGNPSVVIVDEPTAGLDPEERNRFNNLLCELSEEIIVILSTHLVEDVRNLCDEMAIINKGRLVLTGKPSMLTSQLSGKIWNKTVDKEWLMQHEPDFKIISRQLTERKQAVTVYAEESLPDFEQVAPTLEHVYFTTLKQMQANENNIPL